MLQHKKNILVTRPLKGPEIEYARILGLEPIIKPALEFEFPPYWDKVLKVINDNPKSDWIFTSSNGVLALKQLVKAGLNVRPETRVFAVGHKTADALAELDIEATVPPMQDSEHLAKLIIREGKIDSVIYFHGNLSRTGMTETLREKGIEVIGLEVYKTIINEIHMPGKPVDAIVFYSPSAVEALKRGSGFSSTMPPIFAIGPTTAEAVRQASGRQVYVAEEPDTKILLRKISDVLFNREVTGHED